jgi:phage terminase large subunit GpA-like protein
LFFDRFTAFRRTGSFKIFELSTPEIDTGDALGEAPGHCRIDRSFKRSDQRFWNIQCPECGFWQKQFYENFICDRNHPQRSRYLCQACGHEISETERVIGVRSGHFVATAEGPDRHPGFHVDAFDSLMMSYEAIAQNIITYLLPGGWGDRGIYNRVLGLPAVEKGNAPEYERLMERREDYAEGVVPAEGLIVVAAADVQHYGIWAEAVAFSEDRQSWSLTAQFFDGPTDDINAGAWVKVDAFYRKPLVDVFGQERRIEALAVDGGDHGRMNQALEWCRRRPGARAIKGLPGRYVPAVGLPSRKSVTTRGKRRRFGYSDLWPVGTWSLKSEFMADLHKTGLAAGAPADPPGYCHFGNFLTKEYFLQITAESFVTEFVAGKFKEEWKPIRRDNHLLDCRIYAMAMAELLGLTRMTTDDWARLRATIQPAGQTDLLSPSAQRAVAQRKPEAREAESAPSADAGSIAEKRKAWGNRG